MNESLSMETFKLAIKKKQIKSEKFSSNETPRCWRTGGELGIRTLGPFRDTAFRVLHHRPLGQLSIFYFLKHRLARPSDKCKISMQDKREIFRYTPRIQPHVKPNPADESAREPQTFESRLFGHLSTAPCLPAPKRAVLYYNRFGELRQRKPRRRVGKDERFS